MGTIREYEKQDGSSTYHAEVRRKGNEPKRASFPSRKLAEEWISVTETTYFQVSSKEIEIRHNWTFEEIEYLFQEPFPKLLQRAGAVHKTFHDETEVQLCQLISIKTGGCTEDCSYCAQSSKYKTSIKPTAMMKLEEVKKIAVQAKKEGVTRICMGAAWRQVREGVQFDRVLEMVKCVKDLGLESCCTLGMLTKEQIVKLKKAGLYAYNHNLDTSPEHYPKIITTHTFQDRVDTLDRVEAANISVCSGGIFGLGESVKDRLNLLRIFSSRSPHPESVPLNLLTPIPGTPLEKNQTISCIEYVRLIAIARILMPRAMVRLSAGRLSLTDGEQALCFLAGANSIHVGERLLTVQNPKKSKDEELLKSLGMHGRKPYQTTLKPKEEIFLSKRMDQIEEKGIKRALSYKDASLIDFASNDYLGLANSKELASEVKREFEKLVFQDGIRPGIGATGSRLLTGNHPYLERLEKTIATYHKGECALLFNSGYAANTGLLSCIAKENDAVLLDSQVHASTWDGARLSRAKNYVFPHNDLEGLEKQLMKARSKHKEVFVCVESLYSMAGDVAHLNEICTLCSKYRAWLIVDEAHATGILGSEGRGMCADVADTSQILARVFTFGKGLGCHGAAIVGSTLLREYLINQCRTFIYTTAFPLHTLVSIKCVYDCLASMKKEREKLDHLIRYFQLQVTASPLPVKTTQTAIQTIPINGNEAVKGVSRRLQNQGFDIRAICSPTVREGSECLRMCLHSFNTESEIDQLVAALMKEQEEVFIA